MRHLVPQEPPLDEDALRDAYAPDRARPSLRVNFVTSLDGAAEVDGYSKGLSGEADQRVFALLRAHADAVMVGAGTLRHEGYRALRLDEPRRAWRRGEGLAEYPTLVIVSASLDLDPTHAAFADAPVRPIVLTHASASPRRRDPLRAVADVVDCGESAVRLAVGVAELRRRGLSHVLCEGGPQLLGALLAENLVDEMCLTVSPLLAGSATLSGSAGSATLSGSAGSATLSGSAGAGAGRIAAGSDRAPPLAMRLVHLLAEGDMLLARYARAT